MSQMRRVTAYATAAAITAAAATVPSFGAHSHAGMDHPTAGGTATSPKLTMAIARSRLALAPFATSLARAKAAGWNMKITPMIPDMGFHYMNPDIKSFNVRRPPILVYVGRGRKAQLVAAEWVFPSKPAKRPLPGATYGSFSAACHYDDGTFTPHGDEASCPPQSPDSGAAFTFWHPDLVTLHLWMWYPNPDGVFNGTNPLVRPFNES
jgi:hypothetical protein